MNNRYFKIKKSDLIEFLRTKTNIPDYNCPKDSKKIEIKLDCNDYNKGLLSVLIEIE